MVQKKVRKYFLILQKKTIILAFKKNLNKDVIYKRKKTLQKSAIFCEDFLKFTKLIFLP